MLQKPDLEDKKIIACLREHYGLRVVQVAFLPLGADANAAVYRVVADDDHAYFLKLKRGAFDENAVTVPKFLSEQGIPEIIAPIPTREGQLRTMLDDFNVILYPFVDGKNGWQREVSDQQWLALGAAFKRIHNVTVPPALMSSLQIETYSAYWREMVKAFQTQIETEIFADPAAAKLAAFLKTKRGEIHDLIARAEQLVAALEGKSLPFVLCHADIHAGNLLIDASGTLYIVDWDNPILAPKERDLMFIGAGLSLCDQPHQAAAFYEGYGQTEADAAALTYYRYERIVQDIAAYCQQLLLTDEGGEDREEGLRQLVGQFDPGNVIPIAYELEKNLLLPPNRR